MLETIISPAGLSVLAAIGASFLALGRGFKWLLAYIDTRSSVSISAEQVARRELQIQLEERIDQLTKQVDKLMGQNELYLRRIYQLESYITVSGLKLPDLKGWGE